VKQCSSGCRSGVLAVSDSSRENDHNIADRMGAVGAGYDAGMLQAYAFNRKEVADRVPTIEWADHEANIATALRA
jgi:hypothetical protein